MVGNPTPVGWNSTNNSNYYTVRPNDCLWNIAMAEVQREREAAGLAPLKGAELRKQTANELQLIEDANPQIKDKGGSHPFDLIWAGDKIDIPNAPQKPGVASQADSTTSVVTNGGVPGLEIPAGTKLVTGQAYTTPNGQYTLIMQVDGNLVVYQNNSDGTKTAKFSTGTYANNPYGRGVGDHAVIQADGNLVVYNCNNDGDKPGDSVWSSNTYTSGDSNSELVIQNDGNLVIYASNGKSWDAQSHSESNGLLHSDKINGDPNSGMS
jgi:hypothetical protein